jgi:2-oxoglutarate ferredoxin oxidoreductase subunit beta
VNLKILLFNNRIYGLTKGQYSPTSESGKVTKSSPHGSLDFPFNPVSVALGAEATFVARTIDSDRQHLQSVLRAAAEHEGTALVEIYQNCDIFNDNAWEPLKNPDTRDDVTIRLEHGEKLIFGTDRDRCVVRDSNGTLRVASVSEVSEADIVVHDAHVHDPAFAFALSRLSHPETLADTPIGIFRDVARPVYDTLMREQIKAATEKNGPGDLATLLRGNDSWVVS